MSLERESPCSPTTLPQTVRNCFFFTLNCIQGLTEGRAAAPDWDATNPNAKRPAYGPTWGFADGAQDDIFTGGSISTGNTTTGGINTTTTGGSKTVESRKLRKCWILRFLTNLTLCYSDWKWSEYNERRRSGLCNNSNR